MRAFPGTMLVNDLTRKRCGYVGLPEDNMKSPKTKVLTLLDRSLIGLLIFIVMVLVGIQVIHTG
jgi:hypothetical protein